MVPGHGHKAVCVSGHIDLKPYLLVVYVIPALVICRECGFEEYAYTGTGRAIFGIGIHPSDYVLGHIREHPILNTVINIYGTDIPEYTDADSIISSYVRGDRCKLCKCILIGGIRFRAVFDTEP